MRPVNKGNAPVIYTVPTHFTFKKGTIAAGELGQKATVQACLDFWFNTNWYKTRKKRPKGLEDMIKASNTVQGKVDEVYKIAGIPLVQTIGSYCSYCETPLPGLAEVEHIAPKAEYPNFSMNWSNFLLSCGPCNNAKSDNPSREEVAGLLNIAYTQSTPTQDQCKSYIRDTMYVWPDIDDVAYRGLPPDLYYVDTISNTWKRLEVDANNSANLNNTITSIDLSTREVKADIFIAGKLKKNVRVGVLITNKMTTPSTDIGDNTIGLMQLDGLDVNETSTYDRRLVNRTQVWFTVLQQMRLMSAITVQSNFDAVWSFIPMSSVGSGFYSVWVRLLNTMVDPSGINLALRFIADTNKAGMYPNTVTTKLP